MGEVVSMGKGSDTGSSNDAMREDVCEHCAFSNFPVSGSHGDCRANPPTVVIVPQQQRDLATGNMVVIPAAQSVFPPVERRTFCYAFEPAEGHTDD